MAGPPPNGWLARVSIARPERLTVGSSPRSVAWELCGVRVNNPSVPPRAGVSGPRWSSRLAIPTQAIEHVLEVALVKPRAVLNPGRNCSKRSSLSPQNPERDVRSLSGRVE